MDGAIKFIYSRQDALLAQVADYLHTVYTAFLFHTCVRTQSKKLLPLFYTTRKNIVVLATPSMLSRNTRRIVVLFL